MWYRAERTNRKTLLYDLLFSNDYYQFFKHTAYVQGMTDNLLKVHTKVIRQTLMIMIMGT